MLTSKFDDEFVLAAIIGNFYQLSLPGRIEMGSFHHKHNLKQALGQFLSFNIERTSAARKGHWPAAPGIPIDL